jgi:hypothetical protein
MVAFAGATSVAEQHYVGGCHCGAVRYGVDLDLEKGTLRCNCSLCSKSRAWFAFAPVGKFRLQGDGDDQIHYRWTPPGKSQPNLTYHICSTCGVRTHADGVDPKGNAMVAVQVATLEGADRAVLAKSVRYVDGRHDHFDREPEHVDAL